MFTWIIHDYHTPQITRSAHQQAKDRSAAQSKTDYTGTVHDDEVGVEPQPSHIGEPLRVHDRVGRIAGPPAPVHPHELLRGGAVGHGVPQLRARRPQAPFVDALQLSLVRDGRSACVTTARRVSTKGEDYATTETHTEKKKHGVAHREST